MFHGLSLGLVSLEWVRHILLTNEHVFCYGGLSDEREYRVQSLIYKSIAGTIDEFYSINERVAVVVQ